MADDDRQSLIKLASQLPASKSLVFEGVRVVVLCR